MTKISRLTRLVLEIVDWEIKIKRSQPDTHVHTLDAFVAEAIHILATQVYKMKYGIKENEIFVVSNQQDEPIKESI